MRKLDVKSETNEGWMVQVYGRDRRLLCVLEPSHGWTFLIGCGVGLAVAILLASLSDYRPPSEPVESIETPAFQVD